MTSEFRAIAHSLKKHWQSLLQQLSEQRISFTNKTSMTGSEALGNSGLFLLLAKSSKNPRLESLLNDARVVELLLQIVEIQSSSRGKADIAWFALRECFLKMSGLDISAVLQETVPDPPRDFAFIMMQYLAWLDESPTRLTLSTGQMLVEMSMGIIPISDDSLCRKQQAFAFPWQDRGAYSRHGIQYFIAEQCYSCIPISIKPEPKWHKHIEVYLIQGHTRDESLKTYAWIVRNEQQKVAGGFCESMEAAAEQLFYAFFQVITAYKFLEANKPRSGNRIALFGNWMDEAEFASAAKSLRDRCTVFSYDDRTKQVFVMGWPTLRKEKTYTEIATVIGQPNRRHVRCPSNFDYVIETVEGKRLQQSFDWYVCKPEERVEGVVLCGKCNQLFDCHSQDVRWTQTLGVLCSPCIDYLMEKEELSDSALD